MARIDITEKRTGHLAIALQEAEPGDEIIYHVGRFAAGAHKADALKLADSKQCFIYQRKLEHGQFEYIAKKPSGREK